MKLYILKQKLFLVFQADLIHHIYAHVEIFTLKWGGENQAFSWPLTTHGHITDCKLDSVVYAGVL